MQVEYQSSPLSPPECSSAMFQAPLLVEGATKRSDAADHSPRASERDNEY